MHSADWQARVRHDIHEAIARADAETRRKNFEVYAFTLSICDVDIPAFISEGECYLQIPLSGFFDAVEACISNLLGDLEGRVSEAGRAALSLADDERAVPGAWVVVEGLVSDREEWR